MSAAPRAALAALALVLALAAAAPALQQRDAVSYLRGPYNAAFFRRHRASFRIGAALHFAHAKAHDVLALTALDNHALADRAFDGECVARLYQPPKTEPAMDYFGPYVARQAWQLYRVIDWTHMLHEQTYDILSDAGIPWAEKGRWTERAVRYYLEEFDLPRSPAPLEVTMRRAAVMMKPYFTLFRNYYPLSNDFFYYAHWWHPAIYEAMMLAGNGPAQDVMVGQTDEVGVTEVIKDRPLFMMLSREMMPRYARFSPEAANIFDNLHMLHGIAYDILAYKGWTMEQKRAELVRVIKAMSYQPGDERLARKFRTPHPDVDPRIYAGWMRSAGGEMGRMMAEMLEEMTAAMMPGGMTPEQHERLMAQLALKLTPGLQPGELPGSLMDALAALMPAMKMAPASMEPGATPRRMVEVMLAGWQARYGGMANVAPLDMSREPPPPPRLDIRRYQGGEATGRR